MSRSGCLSSTVVAGARRGGRCCALLVTNFFQLPLRACPAYLRRRRLHHPVTNCRWSGGVVGPVPGGGRGGPRGMTRGDGGGAHGAPLARPREGLCSSGGARRIARRSLGRPPLVAMRRAWRRAGPSPCAPVAAWAVEELERFAQFWRWARGPRTSPGTPPAEATGDRRDRGREGGGASRRSCRWTRGPRPGHPRDGLHEFTGPTFAEKRIIQTGTARSPTVMLITRRTITAPGPRSEPDHSASSCRRRNRDYEVIRRAPLHQGNRIIPHWRHSPGRGA